jgi:DNA polymerase-3 subunit gamma/tau
MQDLLETTHFLTRVKVAPGAQGFFDGGSGEAKRAAELAAKLPVSALTRAWQILLKGLFEVRDATRPISACEMALIRLAYAAELPPTDKLVKDLLDGGAIPALRGTGAPTPSPSRAPMASGSAMPARAAIPEGAPTASVRTLEDIVALAASNNAPILKVALENYVHLVRLEPGRIEFRPHPRAPKSLAGDLQQKLRDWTGERWAVSIANQGGAPTLAEQKQLAKTARFEAVAQEPMVRAVLDRFPGAEIVAVRDVVSDDIASSMPESDS